jgi:hypothetical protein
LRFKDIPQTGLRIHEVFGVNEFKKITVSAIEGDLSMKRFLFALVTIMAIGNIPAFAADVGVSINIGYTYQPFPLVIYSGPQFLPAMPPVKNQRTPSMSLEISPSLGNRSPSMFCFE